MEADKADEKVLQPLRFTQGCQSYVIKEGGEEMKRSEVQDYRWLKSVDELKLKVEDGEYVLPDGSQWCEHCDNPAHECICDYVIVDGTPERVEEDDDEISQSPI